MDPLPFLILAVLVFWLVQLGAWAMYTLRNRSVIRGTGEVKNKQWITDLKKKAKKAKK